MDACAWECAKVPCIFFDSRWQRAVRRVVEFQPYARHDGRVKYFDACHNGLCVSRTRLHFKGLSQAIEVAEIACDGARADDA